jgi:3-methylcrotonyl-CoA carboxylase alpha subunit
MADAAIRLCKTAGYDNAGTVEFILDEDGQHYLMEMNTRLQVEHPVTEMVYSVDLVQLQFKVALGEKLPLPQSQIQPQGHAIEVRIYAEDTANGFLPSSGKLTALHLAYGPNRRFDFGYTAGDEITNDYDPMLGKIITWADNRPDNLDRLHATLSRTVITGVKTNIDFLKNLIRHTKFAAGKTHTGFIASEYGGKFSPSNPTKEFSAWINKQNLPSDSGATTSNNPTWISPWQSSTVSHSNPKQNIHTTVIDSSTSAANVSQNGRLSSPMPATVVSMSCKAGSKVKEGDLLAILEAMKMEYPLAAPFDGKIAKIHAKAGDKVGLGDLIIEITR